MAGAGDEGRLFAPDFTGGGRAHTIAGMRSFRRKDHLCGALLVGALTMASAGARAVDFGGLVKKAAGGVASGARDKATKEVNSRLLAEGRKNQCSFKTDSDELAPGCDSKLRNLTNALVEAKKRLELAGITDFKFEVSGHTDTSGSAAHNKELSGKRAATIVRELVARGIHRDQILSVGMGADHPLVTPDDTPSKKAKNRRYEIQLRF
jgi:outer membrane protein OmpA-like peptidoglycan-associated protein